MALTEGAFLKIFKDVLGFNPKKPIDIICLVLILLVSIYSLTTGLVVFGLIFILGFIASYFILKGIFLLLVQIWRFICWIFDLVFYGPLLRRRYGQLHDSEKFILRNFIEENCFTYDFNIQQFSEVHFENLVEGKFLDSFDPTIPSSDRDRLQHAMGDEFVEARINKKLFKYLTANYCEKAVKMGFHLHRADVRQYWRSHGVEW